jgi:hypothetical protein
MYDGNYVIASKHARPWKKQLNLLAGYLYFYNAVWLAACIWNRKTKVGLKPVWMQIIGMLGLVHTIRRTFTWSLRLMFGKIDRLTHPPTSDIPIRSLDEITARHTPISVTVSVAKRKDKNIPVPVAS